MRWQIISAERPPALESARGRRFGRLGRNLTLALPSLLVVLIGPSRVYLGAHWSSDVLEANPATLWVGGC